MTKNQKQKVTKSLHSHKAWVVAVDMGYGHQRAAQPLDFLAYKGILSANAYAGIPAYDRKIWKESRRFYDFISRFKKVPFIGEAAYQLYDRIQEIPTFYPKRDLSKPILQVSAIYRLMRKKNWGKHLISTLGKKPLPLITTFFVPAFMAEHYNYPGEIYCLLTDTDVSRAWVTEKPTSSRIKYFAPNYRVMDRLREYGVDSSRIFLTGFPLPTENTGSPKLEVLKGDLANRLVNLDPKKRYLDRYGKVVQEHLGRKSLPARANHPLTITFAVGGAGAQQHIGAIILKSLAQLIQQKKVKLNLVAGIHNSVSVFFRKNAVSCGLRKELDRGVQIIHANTKALYFRAFNQALRTTDVLWTKPSELSFYCALGIPIVIAPPIGSQENFNEHWLTTIGAGVKQEDPRYAHQWLLDWVKSGWLAEAAMEGFVEAPKFGTYNIEHIVFHEMEKTIRPKIILQF